MVRNHEQRTLGGSDLSLDSERPGVVLQQEVGTCQQTAPTDRRVEP